MVAAGAGAVFLQAALRVGRLLAGQCAPTLKRVSMELGGAAPLIVFADADLDLAVAETIKGKFRNSGQTCVCPNRVYVEASVADAYAEKLAAEVAKIPACAPMMSLGGLGDTETAPTS